ncbi:MAG: hemolysin III family protein [Oscillospiraceae bacterium]|nr:hemolysin III family protein [Oscillospiraceae bacterium]MDD7470874.1 hemolysin III family protein [Oscillospiraceae bacterium]MDY2678355.1 hemolysin III family protein [Oscillospiraceae bacterium]
MTDLKSVSLPHYSEREEKINSVSHAVGIGFGLTAAFSLCLKAQNALGVISGIIFGVSIIILYAASTVYHILSPSPAKRIMRTVDHAVIYVLIAGTSIPLIIMGVLPFSHIFGTVMTVLSLVIEAVGIFITFFDLERFRVLSMVLYMTLGWMCITLIYPLYKYSRTPLATILLILIGGVVYTVGTTFLALGKKKKYYHSIFHFFVLLGTMLHFFGLYTLY